MELKLKSFKLLDKATADIIHKFSIQQKLKYQGRPNTGGFFMLVILT